MRKTLRTLLICLLAANLTGCCQSCDNYCDRYYNDPCAPKRDACNDPCAPRRTGSAPATYPVEDLR
jgi:hypothetical protein